MARRQDGAARRSRDAVRRAVTPPRRPGARRGRVRGRSASPSARRGYAGAGTRDDARVALVDAVVAACARSASSKSAAAGASWRSGSRARPERRSSRSTSRRAWSSWRWSAESTRASRTCRTLPFADGEFDCRRRGVDALPRAGSRAGLAEIARVLRPGGTFVAATNSRFHLIELRELVGSGPSTLQVLARGRRGASSRALRASSARRRRRRPARSRIVRSVEDYVRASISMSPFSRQPAGSASTSRSSRGGRARCSSRRRRREDRRSRRRCASSTRPRRTCAPGKALCGRTSRVRTARDRAVPHPLEAWRPRPRARGRRRTRRASGADADASCGAASRSSTSRERMVELARARGIPTRTSATYKDSRSRTARSTPSSPRGCSTTSRISIAALAEIARVLQPDGAPRRRHEFDRAHRGAAQRSSTRCMRAYEHQFNAENGRSTCAVISRRSSGSRRTSSRSVDDREMLVDYRRLALVRDSTHCRTTSSCRSASTAARRSSWRRNDPPGRADPAQARRRGAAPTTSSPSSSSATRAARCPTTRWRRSAWRSSSAGCRRARRSCSPTR